MIEQKSPVKEENKQGNECRRNNTKKQGQTYDPKSNMKDTVSKQQMSSSRRRQVESPSVLIKNIFQTLGQYQDVEQATKVVPRGTDHG